MIIRARRYSRKTHNYLPMIFAVCCFLVLSSMPCSAGIPGADCLYPEVLTGADVNTFILDFTYPDNPEEDYSNTARKLALLLQQDALFSQLKYRSIAVTQLLVDPDRKEHCTHNFIFQETFQQLRDSAGVIVMSGQIFQDGDQVYIQTNLQFARMNASETIELEVYSRDSGITLALTGSLPAKYFSFPPRKVARSVLDEIDSIYSANLVLRPDPDIYSPGTPIPIDPFSSSGYRVTEFRDGWMHVELWDGSLSGWIRADLSETRLRQKLPELDFLNAVAGYIRYRAGRHKMDAKEKSAIIEEVEKSLLRYESNTDERKEPIPIANLNAMTGILKILEFGVTKALLLKVDSYFERAAKLMPQNGSAQSLKNIVSIYKNYANSHEKNTELALTKSADKFLKIIKAEPSNFDALSNLEGVYLMMLAHRIKVPFDTTGQLNRLTEKELREQIEIIRDWKREKSQKRDIVGG